MDKSIYPSNLIQTQYRINQVIQFSTLLKLERCLLEYVIDGSMFDDDLNIDYIPRVNQEEDIFSIIIDRRPIDLFYILLEILIHNFDFKVWHILEYTILVNKTESTTRMDFRLLEQQKRGPCLDTIIFPNTNDFPENYFENELDWDTEYMIKPLPI